MSPVVAQGCGLAGAGGRARWVRGAGGITAGRRGRGLGQDKREAGSPPSAPANNGGMRVERARGPGGPMHGAGAPLARHPELLRGCLLLPAHGTELGAALVAPAQTRGHPDGREQPGEHGRGMPGGQSHAGGAEPPAQQLLPGLSSWQLMGLPATQQSSLAPASLRPLSLLARALGSPAPCPDPPSPASLQIPPAHTQVLGPFLTPLLCLLVPRLGFLGICGGRSHESSPQTLILCHVGTSIPGAPSPPRAPTLLGPGAGSRSWRGCGWGAAVTPGGHVL